MIINIPLNKDYYHRSTGRHIEIQSVQLEEKYKNWVVNYRYISEDGRQFGRMSQNDLDMNYSNKRPEWPKSEAPVVNDSGMVHLQARVDSLARKLQLLEMAVKRDLAEKREAAKPKTLKVGDEISQKDWDELPVGSVFTHKGSKVSRVKISATEQMILTNGSYGIYKALPNGEVPYYIINYIHDNPSSRL